MSEFQGNWKNQKAPGTATITENGDSVVVTGNGGRGPFQGRVTELSSPVIDVNFTDDQEQVGVLSIDEDKIYWGNGTVWERVED